MIRLQGVRPFDAQKERKRSNVIKHINSIHIFSAAFAEELPGQCVLREFPSDSNPRRSAGPPGEGRLGMAEGSQGGSLRCVT